MSQYRNPALTTAPTVFSYTPTGRAVPTSSPLRTPDRRPAAPSCTPTGRVVLSTPTTHGSA
ncbi:hypothetical protein G6031_06815 [Dietzia sp. CQ4]|uniref:Uncharacterized protein n=1 Tax=Dietzia natronolimnaea TaxID=161920 RepID=A0A2A2WUA5_9ACTN|nr:MULTISPECIES: hypothetical protein [Dietzia]MBB1034101.1 hypothetical protein [Dietzia sp. CQ4]PAY24623.1 hypothetical protein CEY15_02160 [Dietzia natronolimnaea]